MLFLKLPFAVRPGLTGLRVSIAVQAKFLCARVSKLARVVGWFEQPGLLVFGVAALNALLEAALCCYPWSHQFKR